MLGNVGEYSSRCPVGRTNLVNEVFSEVERAPHELGQAERAMLGHDIVVEMHVREPLHIPTRATREVDDLGPIMIESAGQGLGDECHKIRVSTVEAYEATEGSEQRRDFLAARAPLSEGHGHRGAGRSHPQPSRPSGRLAACAKGGTHHLACLPLKADQGVVDAPPVSDYFSAPPPSQRPVMSNPSPPSHGWIQDRRILLVLAVAFATTLPLGLVRHIHQAGDSSAPPDPGGYSMPQNSAEGAKEICLPPSFAYEGFDIRSETVTKTSATTWHIEGIFTSTVTSTGQRERFGFECDAEFPGNGYLPHGTTSTWQIPD